MSYELILYSPQTAPVDKAQLKTALETRGWRVAFVGETALLENSGALEDNLIVTGCDAQNAKADEFAEWAEIGDFRALMELASNFPDEVLGCEIVGNASYQLTDDFSAAEIAEMQTDSGEAYVQARSAARAQYVVSMANREVDMDFGDSVAQAIAALISGLLEDPQEDTHEIIAAA